jgi:hypothetical protein
VMMLQLGLSVCRQLASGRLRPEQQLPRLALLPQPSRTKR